MAMFDKMIAIFQDVFAMILKILGYFRPEEGVEEDTTVVE